MTSCPKCNEEIEYLNKYYSVHASATEEVRLVGNGKFLDWDKFQLEEIYDSYDYEYSCPNCGHIFQELSSGDPDVVMEFLKDKKEW